MYSRNPNGTSQYRRTPRSNILRQLFAVWMKHGGRSDDQFGFKLDMQYDIKQCLPRAIDLVRAGSAAGGGKGGGGRPDMAQAGGPDGTAGAAALKAIEEAVASV